MNICIINAFFPPHVSGTAREAFLLSRGLSRRGHKVIVVTSRIKGAPWVEKYDGVVVYRLQSVKYPKLDIFHRADLYYNLLPGNFRAMMDIAKRHEIDVIQAYGQFFDLTFMAVAASKMLKVPVALTIGTRMEHPRSSYDSFFLFADKTLVKHLVARRVDRVIALDKLMRDYIIRRYNISEQSIRFIPAAVDVERFERCDGQPIRRQYNIEDDSPIILSLGTISNLRKPVSLIKAMPSVLREFPNSKLLFVGCLYSYEAIHLARKLGLGDSIIFCGEVDYAMIPSYIGACDVEGHDLDSGLGLGLASLEAMSAGKPVLSSVDEDNFMGLKLSNWKNIVLVPPGNVRAISQAIVRLLSDRKLREEIGRNAMSFVKEHFSLDVVCQKYEALYDEMLK
jgi:glycosyltransferase involved in cell wall biosynthesis